MPSHQTEAPARSMAVPFYAPAEMVRPVEGAQYTYVLTERHPDAVAASQPERKQPRWEI
ncbi:hypothetical protein ABZ746_23385 [Streptomyces sp. NPDC020096]